MVAISKPLSVNETYQLANQALSSSEVLWAHFISLLSSLLLTCWGRRMAGWAKTPPKTFSVAFIFLPKAVYSELCEF